MKRFLKKAVVFGSLAFCAFFGVYNAFAAGGAYGFNQSTLALTPGESGSAGAIVTPNLTEAALMTGLGTEEELERLLEALLEQTGAKCALITGARAGNARANVWMEREGGGMRALEYAAEEGEYPGTGDLFAAVLAREYNWEELTP